MSTEAHLANQTMEPRPIPPHQRSWWLRRLCSQNPFYLISVCLVLHGTANWFHRDSGIAFSPWPLLWLTAGYTLLLALTGFVIIRFGQVWEDARSILLTILLMFVQLALLFDETVVSNPPLGRWLLLICWAFSAMLSELLLLGLKIRLPLLYRVPYHLLLALLYFYPLWLAVDRTAVSNDRILLRIFLFPGIAALIFLTLIPAIRRGRSYSAQNGTPWLWPWYPWSLYVFFAACICFRAYALSQSFDPLLGETLSTAMSFSSAFGVYFLVPMVFAAAVLFLEIGLVEQRRTAVNLGLFLPLIGLWLAYPDLDIVGPYRTFLLDLVQQVGSPLWLTLIGACLFYFVAVMRGVKPAEHCLVISLLLLTNVDSRTLDTHTIASFQNSQLLTLGAVELLLGVMRVSSQRVFIGICLTAILTLGRTDASWLAFHVRDVLLPFVLLMTILAVGALYRDRFAWYLRIAGAPLLVLTILILFVVSKLALIRLSTWNLLAIVALLTIISLRYAAIVRMPLYLLASALCAVSGLLGMTEIGVSYLILESRWNGATSFAMGIGFLVIATVVSSRKAGWLNQLLRWIKGALIIPQPGST